MSVILTLSYSLEINTVLCSQKVSLPLKKPLWYRIEFWRVTILKKKCDKRPLLRICSRLPHPNRALWRTVCIGQKDPKAIKTLWDMICRPILDFFFLKANVNTINSKRLSINPGTVSSRWLWVKDVWTMWGQVNPPMNKRGLMQLKTGQEYNIVINCCWL